MNYCLRTSALRDSSLGGPQNRGADSFDCRSEKYDKDVLLSNSRDPEIVQNLSQGNSSLRTSSIWLAFVIGESVLDSQKMLYKFSYSRLGNNLYFVIFPRKQDLTFHTNCLHWRQFG